MGCPSPVTKGFFKEIAPPLRASLNPWVPESKPRSGYPQHRLSHSLGPQRVWLLNFKKVFTRS